MDVLKEGLQKVRQNTRNESFSDTSLQCQLFSTFYNQWSNGRSLTTYSTHKSIPKFHKDIPDKALYDELLPSKLELEARTMLLERISNTLLETDELETLRTLLDEHSSEEISSEKIISYTSLKEVISKASPKCKSYDTTKLFAQLQNSEVFTGVSIVSLFTYAMRKTWLKRTRIGLSVYDTTGKGFLREAELESFIEDLIPDCPQLCSLKKTFHPFYVCTVVRKFVFFLDPIRTGRIRIKDMLASNFLDDLLVLRNEDLPEYSQEENWFSAPSALRVYGQYLTLDKDSNGMLSRSELAEFGTGTLNDIFVERVFQECLTYEGEMDYKAYLDFILALENKQEPQALRYFFKILDINGMGYLDAFSLNYFFRDVQKEMKKYQEDPVSFEDIKDELFDMVRPADPTKITLQDVLNCGKGEYFVSILTDLNEFWNYENRECN